MDLQGIKVLVDGYNLSLINGTGIKTYGTSLINALNILGAEVDVLFSSNSYKDIKILDEILLFDINEQEKTSRGKRKLFNIKTIKNIFQASSGFFYKADKIKLGDFVIKTKLLEKYSFLNSVGVVNLDNCYTIANFLYDLTGIVTKIHPPEKIDIWHSTYQIPIKIKGAKKITTIHDLVPLKLPYASLDDKVFFYKTIQNSLKTSDLIITISENSKKDILEVFDVDSSKIIVTYQPIVIQPPQCNSEEVSAILLKKYRLDYKKYILFVGTIEPKKNVGRLIDAYAHVNPDIPLLIVGKKGWLWQEEIEKFQATYNDHLKAKIKLLEYVPNNDLRYLYAGACCFVFPSLYEGFGLPVLEAMTCGCPVITSNTSSLPEICGDAALYVDPYDIDSIAKKLEQLITNQDLLNSLTDLGRERAKLFSMEIYVKKLYQAYSQLI